MSMGLHFPTGTADQVNSYLREAAMLRKVAEPCDAAREPSDLVSLLAACN